MFPFGSRQRRSDVCCRHIRYPLHDPCAKPGRAASLTSFCLGGIGKSAGDLRRVDASGRKAGKGHHVPQSCRLAVTPHRLGHIPALLAPHFVPPPQPVQRLGVTIDDRRRCLAALDFLQPSRQLIHLIHSNDRNRRNRPPAPRAKAGRCDDPAQVGLAAQTSRRLGGKWRRALRRGLDRDRRIESEFIHAELKRLYPPSRPVQILFQTLGLFLRRLRRTRAPATIPITKTPAGIAWDGSGTDVAEGENVPDDFCSNP